MSSVVLFALITLLLPQLAVGFSPCAGGEVAWTVNGTIICVGVGDALSSPEYAFVIGAMYVNDTHIEITAYKTRTTPYNVTVDVNVYCFFDGVKTDSVTFDLPNEKMKRVVAYAKTSCNTSVVEAEAYVSGVRVAEGRLLVEHVSQLNIPEGVKPYIYFLIWCILITPLLINNRRIAGMGSISMGVLAPYLTVFGLDAHVLYATSAIMILSGILILLIELKENG